MGSAFVVVVGFSPNKFLFLSGKWCKVQVRGACVLDQNKPKVSHKAKKMLKLRLSYFGHLMRRQDSLEKTMMLGKVEGSRRRGRPQCEMC